MRYALYRGWVEVAPGVEVRLLGWGAVRLRARDGKLLVADHEYEHEDGQRYCSFRLPKGGPRCGLSPQRHGPFLSGTPKQRFARGAEIEVRIGGEDRDAHAA